MRFLALFTIFAFIFVYVLADLGFRTVRGDMSSVFFSPFRVGKRNQFYGLYKHYGRDSPAN